MAENEPTPSLPPWTITTLDNILRYCKAINDRDIQIERQLQQVNLRLNNMQQAVLVLTEIAQAEAANISEIQSAVSVLGPEVAQILNILTAVPPPPQPAGFSVVVTDNPKT